MFEKIRDSLRTLLDGATGPEDRRAILASMKETLVHAKMGVDDLRGGVTKSRARLAEARLELETISRRKSLAAGIGDMETVAVAERFERQAVEIVAVLAQKLDAQERELAIVEAEVVAMSGDFKAAMAGATPRGGVAQPGSGPLPDPLAEEDAALRQEFDQMNRERSRAATDAAVEDRLAALKRRMGK
jgi:hypothetical protein